MLADKQATKGAAGRRVPCLRSDRRGSIAVVAALCLVVLMGSAAVAIDLAKVYLTKAADQRIADQSALAAAFAYGQSSSNSTTAAQKAASALATSNGATGATVTTTIVTSPKTAADKAAMVVVTSPVSLTPFARASASLASVSVSATAYAEIHDQAVPCLLALSAGGVTDSGGSSITGTGCSLASNGSVSGTNGTKITAQAIYAVGSIGGGATYTTTPTGQTYPGSSAVPDPYSAAGVFSRQSTVAALTAPTFPSVGSAPSGGSNITCSGNTTVPAGQHAYVFATAPACTSVAFGGGSQETDLSGYLSMQGSAGTNLTVTFAAGVYKIGGIQTSGGAFTATLNLASGVTLYVWNGIGVLGATSLTVNGPATYYVQGGIANSGNAIAFTNANNASSTSTFYVSGGITVGTGSGTFPNGVYSIASGGISVGGGTLTFGNGSFDIAGGISGGGGSSLTFGSQLDGNSVFQVDSPPSGNGSNGDASYTAGSLTIGSFTNHDFNGPFVVAGNTSLGAGEYTIEGEYNAAQSGGKSITGTNVSVVASGAITFAQGYDNIDLTAPSAIVTATVGTSPTVVLATNSSDASTITAGATNTVLVGAVYLPNSDLSMAGAAAVGGNGGCMIIVAKSLTLTAAGSVSTDCTDVQSSIASGVALVQ